MWNLTVMQTVEVTPLRIGNLPKLCSPACLHIQVFLWVWVVLCIHGTLSSVQTNGHFIICLASLPSRLI